MPIQDAEELFITILSNVRAREERSLQIWQEMSQMAEREEVKEILETRVFLTKEAIHNLDEAFRLLGKQPIQPTTTRLHDVFVEDFRREYNEIPSPQLKALYVIHKAQSLVQLQISAYTGLIAMADFMGDIPVSALLETNRAAEMVFVDRAKLLMRMIGEAVVARRLRKAA
jgi:ferritin-like metal-binding protein YciE